MDEAANGVYATGVRIMELVYFFPMALAPSFLSRLTSTYTHSNAAFYTTVKQYFVLSSATAVVLSVVLFLVGPLVIQYFFGLEFSASASVLQGYSLSLLGTFWGVAASQILVTIKQSKINLYRTLISVILNVMLNVLWIPRFGIMGATWASVVSYMINPVAMLLWKQSRYLGKEMLYSLLPHRWFRMAKSLLMND